MKTQHPILGFAVQVGALAMIAVSAAVLISGLIIASGGFAGFALLATGNHIDFPMWAPTAMLAGGIFIGGAGYALGQFAVTKVMSATLAQTLLGSALAGGGLFLAWVALGILGVSSQLGLDPFGVFKYAVADSAIDTGIMYLMTVAGLLIAIVGVITLPVPQFARVRALLRD